MSGASDGPSGISVSSWGWRTVDGDEWREWRVWAGGKPSAFIIVPTHSPLEALAIACRMFRDLPDG